MGVARAAGFEQLAGVFASCGALHYAKILASLKIKNAFTFALNDSADALVERLSKLSTMTLGNIVSNNVFVTITQS